MPDDIRTLEFTYPSFDGVSNIHAMVWRPPIGVQPHGIVQLIHGMAEHIERYDAFARFLASAGFLVCGHDHIGHGHSVSSRDELGHMPPENGAEVLVEDVDTLRYIVQHAFDEVEVIPTADGPDIVEGKLPYFIFGHSMGSFTLRVYLTRHGQGLAGAIICGTGQQPQPLSLMGNTLARLGSRFRGERMKSHLIHNMADGAFVRQVDDPQTEFDWISSSRQNIDDYIEDELNGFQFTLGGYATLTRLTLLAVDLELAKQIPNSLPLLFIAGSKDPVGDQGAGVKAAAQMMERAGQEDVEVILYDGMRHEVLNEEDSDLVFDDVLAWLEAVCLERE